MSTVLFFIAFVVTLVIVSICRFVIEVFKKSYQITIVSLGGEKMTGEKRQKYFYTVVFPYNTLKIISYSLKKGRTKNFL